MFIMRTSSDVQLVQSIRTYFALCVLPVLILAALNYHIHNPYRLLSIGQECRSTFAGVIFEDTNQDGALGLGEKTLDGLVTLQNKTDATIQEYETTKQGIFLFRDMQCGVYEVSYENIIVGEIEIEIVMSGELYTFAAPKGVGGVEYIMYIYLPYIAH